MGSTFFSQPKCLHHSDSDAVRMMSMPMIVKTKYGDVVLADEVEFVLEGRIVLEFFGCVLVYIEGGFMGNDDVLARSHGPLDHIECGHHGDGNASNRRIRVSGEDAINRLRPPGNAHVITNSFHHLGCGELGGSWFGFDERRR